MAGYPWRNDHHLIAAIGYSSKNPGSALRRRRLKDYPSFGIVTLGRIGSKVEKRLF